MPWFPGFDGLVAHKSHQSTAPAGRRTRRSSSATRRRRSGSAIELNRVHANTRSNDAAEALRLGAELDQADQELAGAATGVQDPLVREREIAVLVEKAEGDAFALLRPEEVAGMPAPEAVLAPEPALLGVRGLEAPRLALR